jgi:aminomethyltransferase
MHDSLKKTPLSYIHEELGAKMVDFAGWYMPVQYEGILLEHKTVRAFAGLFDLSHMGELWIEGSDALANINRLCTNDISKLLPGQVQYNLLTNSDGGCIDDLIVYCVSPRKYMLVVNAVNTDKDREWIKNHLFGEVTFEDKSPQTALIALQGPKSEQILAKYTNSVLSEIKTFHFVEGEVTGYKAIISRTGYTGEDGFEIYLDTSFALPVWETLLSVNRTEGLKPIGLGARDTLRLEARLTLYGHELNEEITPLEAGLGYFTKLEKEDFIGKQALLKQKEEGVNKRLVGFVVEEGKGIPRQGYGIYKNDIQIGVVTSGSYSPSTDRIIGFGYVETKYADENQLLDIDIRGKKYVARVIKGKFLTALSNSK